MHLQWRPSAEWRLLSFACGVFAAEPTPVESAKPMVGTAEHGHVYPGATVPFGMVQLSPDTRLDTWDGCSGYHYSDKTILGFSHTHLSGTGCADLGDIRVTPLRGKIPPMKGHGCPQAFSHDDEIATPGYYRVTFTDPKIKAELTATAHAGFHRYTFPQGETPRLLFDLGHGIASDPVEGKFVVEKEHGHQRISPQPRLGRRQDLLFRRRVFPAVRIATASEVNDKPLAADAKEAKGAVARRRTSISRTPASRSW